MKLVPFVLTQKEPTSNYDLRKYKWLVFMSHAGRGIWNTDEPGLISEQTIQQDYLIPNGIVSSRIYIDKVAQIAWIQVNPQKTNLADFYSWEEALANTNKPECWRPFYFFKDAHNADWWSGKGIEGDAEIQGLGNVAEHFADILRIFA